jgi:hypothetical protein
MKPSSAEVCAQPHTGLETERGYLIKHDTQLMRGKFTVLLPYVSVLKDHMIK